MNPKYTKLTLVSLLLVACDQESCDNKLLCPPGTAMEGFEYKCPGFEACDATTEEICGCTGVAANMARQAIKNAEKWDGDEVGDTKPNASPLPDECEDESANAAYMCKQYMEWGVDRPLVSFPPIGDSSTDEEYAAWKPDEAVTLPVFDLRYKTSSRGGGDLAPYAPHTGTISLFFLPRFLAFGHAVLMKWPRPGYCTGSMLSAFAGGITDWGRAICDVEPCCPVYEDGTISDNDGEQNWECRGIIELWGTHINFPYHFAYDDEATAQIKAQGASRCMSNRGHENFIYAALANAATLSTVEYLLGLQNEYQTPFAFINITEESFDDLIDFFATYLEQPEIVLAWEEIKTLWDEYYLSALFGLKDVRMPRTAWMGGCAFRAVLETRNYGCVETLGHPCEDAVETVTTVGCPSGYIAHFEEPVEGTPPPPDLPGPDVYNFLKYYGICLFGEPPVDLWSSMLDLDLVNDDALGGGVIDISEVFQGGTGFYGVTDTYAADFLDVLLESLMSDDPILTTIPGLSAFEGSKVHSIYGRFNTREEAVAIDHNGSYDTSEMEGERGSQGLHVWFDHGGTLTNVHFYELATSLGAGAVGGVEQCPPGQLMVGSLCIDPIDAEPSGGDEIGD